MQSLEELERRGAGYKLKHRYQLDHEVFKLVLDRCCATPAWN